MFDTKIIHGKAIIVNPQNTIIVNIPVFCDFEYSGFDIFDLAYIDNNNFRFETRMAPISSWKNYFYDWYAFKNVMKTKISKKEIFQLPNPETEFLDFLTFTENKTIVIWGDFDFFVLNRYFELFKIKKIYKIFNLQNAYLLFAFINDPDISKINVKRLDKVSLELFSDEDSEDEIGHTALSGAIKTKKIYDYLTSKVKKDFQLSINDFMETFSELDTLFKKLKYLQSKSNKKKSKFYSFLKSEECDESKMDLIFSKNQDTQDEIEKLFEKFINNMKLIYSQKIIDAIEITLEKFRKEIESQIFKKIAEKIESFKSANDEKTEIGS